MSASPVPIQQMVPNQGNQPLNTQQNTQGLRAYNIVTRAPVCQISQLRAPTQLLRMQSQQQLQPHVVSSSSYVQVSSPMVYNPGMQRGAHRVLSGGNVGLQMPSGGKTGLQVPSSSNTGLQPSSDGNTGLQVAPGSRGALQVPSGGSTVPQVSSGGSAAHQVPSSASTVQQGPSHGKTPQNPVYFSMPHISQPQPQLLDREKRKSPPKLLLPTRTILQVLHY